MTKIDLLLEKLCPNGVSFLSLGEVANIQTGQAFDKTNLGGDFPVWNGGVTSHQYVFESNTPGNTITIPARGSVGIVGYQKLDFWCGPLCYRIRFLDSNNSNRFLYFFLKSIESTIQSLQQSGSIPALNKKELECVRIPLPPIEVQNEIVDILDKFAELGAELEAELEARISQFEHYRRHLLSFRDMQEDGVRWIPLGEICEYRKERSKSSVGTYMYVGVEDLLQERRGVSAEARYVSSTGHDIFMPGDVLLGNIRPYLKKVWRADVEGRTNGDVLVLTPKEEFLTELDKSYLYFLLSSDDFFGYCVQTSKGAKMPRGDKQAILRYEIPVPSVEIQKRIAIVLNAFEQLTQDLEIGLPAEQATRRQQYEYYRNKLLTFKKLEVA
jgi:type I restriction enzyme S subunit